MTIDDRFWQKVTRGTPNECWEWRAAKTRGYGQFGRFGAHRWLYEREKGPVPNGLQLDHLCRNRACVNPAHLEPVTRKENILRGVCPTADNARKTHCSHGHEFTKANTGIGKTRGDRICRTCKREEAFRRLRASGKWQGNVRNSDRTHCPSGHMYAGPNLWIDKKGRRLCRACARFKTAQRRARQKAETLAL